MPRRSYEQHRAGKLLSPSGRGRGTSVIESETDAESLASFSTYRSNSSYLTSNPPLPSPRLGSFSSNGHSHSVPFDGSSRYASTSHGLNGPHGPSHLSTGYGDAGPSRVRQPSPSSIHGLSPSPGLDFRQRAFSSSSSQSPSIAPYHGASTQYRVSTSIEEDRARRKTRREERIRKSTLRGEAYDSPLRRIIRWASTHGWSDLSLPLGIGVVLLQRILLLVLEKSRGGAQGREAVWRLGVECLTVWSGVISWIILRAKREGRSWRSQWSGIMTILLSPSLVSVSSASTSSVIQLGLFSWAITLLSADQDIPAILQLSLATAMRSNGWWYTPSVAAYVGGKSIWMGGRRGLSHAGKWVLALTSVLIVHHYTGFTIDRLLGYMPIDKSAADTSPLATPPWLILKTWLPIVTPVGQVWISILATAVTIAPSILILLYASLSIGKASSKSTFPPQTVRLLLPALFSTAIAAYIFAPTSTWSLNDLQGVILPLGLMMSLRGGKETGMGENEVWEMGVLLNNLVALQSFATTPTLLPLVGRISTLAFWNWIIGYNPLSVQSDVIRSGGLILYAVSGLASNFRLLQHSASPTLSALSDLGSLVQTSVLILTLGWFWGWGNMKLIEGTWAITGLGSSLKTKSSRERKGQGQGQGKED